MRNHGHFSQPILAAAALLLTVCWACVPAAEEAAENKSDGVSKVGQQQKAALAKFNDLIGRWRGTGLPRRGSTAGAWTQNAEWVWDFENDGVSLRYNIERDDSSGDATFQNNIEEGLLVDQAKLTYDVGKKVYRLQATYSDDADHTLIGTLNDNRLTLESIESDELPAYRITITLLNEKRTLVLNERRTVAEGRFHRVAEVGYTREGTSLAGAGSAGPMCIVTGGAGTSTVTYNGKTYYVCCSGCRQAFEDDPEGILADAAERVAELKKESR